MEAFDVTCIDDILKDFPNPAESLISLLQAVQEKFGYLPREAMEALAARTSVPLSQIWGVATFYTQFKLTRPGKYRILVCLGTACHVNGGGEVASAVQEALGVTDGATTPDGLFSWESVACLGCCSLSPAMMINGRAYGSLTREKTLKIIAYIRAQEGRA